MPPSEGHELDPAVRAELETIDATLAGEAVDPLDAELAELTLLLAGDAPRMSDDFASSLDDRVMRRFEAPHRGRPARGAWWRRPALGVALSGLAATAAVAVAVTLGGGPSSSSRVHNGAEGTVAATTGSAAQSAPGSAAPFAPHRTASGALGASSAAQASKAPAGVNATAAPGSAAPVPAPLSRGRKQVQSAQLQLTAANDRIDAVAQEVFDTVGAENGIVTSSQITASAANGFAFFSLSIPSGNLQETLGRLSDLRYARVASRTDATQDVTGEYAADVRRLADARALRTSLLKQLASATTTTEIESLRAQIHDAEASIASDEATLRGLQHRVDYSALSVQINAAPVQVPVARHASGGFTLGRAAHDAVRVLAVAAGVALIALAALIPVALLVALVAWIAYWVRRRRREHALDAA